MIGLFGLLVDLRESLIDYIHRDVENGFAAFAHWSLRRTECQIGLILLEECFGVTLLSR